MAIVWLEKEEVGIKLKRPCILNEVCQLKSVNVQFSTLVDAKIPCVFVVLHFHPSKTCLTFHIEPKASVTNDKQHTLIPFVVS